MLNKNSYLLGILIGTLFPVILFGIMMGIDSLTGVFSTSIIDLPLKKKLFVSIALNIIPIRYYFVHRGVENTGKGILIVTVLVILFVTVIL